MHDTAERDAPASNIKTLPDALWWAATTVTTVGYGDRYPTTGTGRVIAASRDARRIKRLRSPPPIRPASW